MVYALGLDCDYLGKNTPGRGQMKRKASRTTKNANHDPTQTNVPGPAAGMTDKHYE